MGIRHPLRKGQLKWARRRYQFTRGRKSISAHAERMTLRRYGKSPQSADSCMRIWRSFSEWAKARYDADGDGGGTAGDDIEGNRQKKKHLSDRQRFHLL